MYREGGLSKRWFFDDEVFCSKSDLSVIPTGQKVLKYFYQLHELLLSTYDNTNYRAYRDVHLKITT